MLESSLRASSNHGVAKFELLPKSLVGASSVRPVKELERIKVIIKLVVLFGI